MANTKTTTPEVSKYREFLEKQIIAAAFSYPHSALEVVSICMADNFKLRLAKILFKIIRVCNERGENTPDAYTKEFWVQHPTESPADLIHYIETNCMGDMVREKCIILVELDMRERFSDVLRQNELLAAANEDFEKATMWAQSAQYLSDPRKDIFEAIPQVKKYLSTYATDELDDFNRLEAAIPKVIDRVRGQERARRFIDTMTALATSPDFDAERRESIDILKDLLICCISRLPLPENLNQTLSTLKSNSWQLPHQSQKSMTF